MAMRIFQKTKAALDPTLILVGRRAGLFAWTPFASMAAGMSHEVAVLPVPGGNDHTLPLAGRTGQTPSDAAVCFLSTNS